MEKSITYVGLDVHKNSIVMSLWPMKAVTRKSVTTAPLTAVLMP